MMAICDVYDALRAGDRPYKSALTSENALDLVAAYVKSGKLDGDYFDVFLKARIYRHTGRWDTCSREASDISFPEAVYDFVS